MAQTLRRPLTSAAWLAALPVALVFGPVLPGLFEAMAPAWQGSVWLALWNDGQWPLALRTTLISSGAGSTGALALATLVAMRHYPGRHWHRVQVRLPLLLSLPHAAFAIGLFFWLAPSGWLARLLAQWLGWASPPGWVTVQDPWGLSLALALAIKESWFLLWVLAALLGEQDVQRQMVLARSLGYSRTQAWRQVLWPQLAPRLAWPMVAVWAYGLSVVDMAIVLGPGTPPTLAVLAWHWLTAPDPALQARGASASIVLLGLLVLGVGLVRVLYGRWQRLRPYPDGLRRPDRAQGALSLQQPLFLTGYAVVAMLALWSVAQGWYFPALWPEALSLQSWHLADTAPFWTTLALGVVAALLCLPMALAWLEWGPPGWQAALYWPLIVPALPLAAGQYNALLRLRLDGTALGVVWSHLLWVLPYMVLTLVGPYRAFDTRLATTARALGHSAWGVCLRVKWPVLLRPILAALAVGFAVSVAQYLPTLFAGGGRLATVTTEAVALSAGGNRRVLAVQALLQIALPMAAFGLAAGMARWSARHRLGLR